MSAVGAGIALGIRAAAPYIAAAYRNRGRAFGYINSASNAVRLGNYLAKPFVESVAMVRNVRGTGKYSSGGSGRSGGGRRGRGGGSGFSSTPYKKKSKRTWKAKPGSKRSPLTKKGVTSRLGTYKRKRMPNANKSLEKRLRSLEKKSNIPLSRLTYRNIYTTLAAASSNTKAATSASLLGTTTGLQAALAQLRYYSVDTNNLVINNITTATFNQKIKCTIVSKLAVRNNYQVPCDVRIYGLRPKGDKNDSPGTLLTTGLAVQGGSSATSVNTYLTDSDLVLENWAIFASKKVRLNPGQEANGVFSSKEFEYNPADYNAENMTFSRKFGSYYWYISVVGILGHASGTATDQGTLAGAVDVIEQVTLKVVYDSGGVRLNDHLNNVAGLDSMTTPVVSEMPFADNMIYSVS